MHDFFTELDSDLRSIDSPKHGVSPENTKPVFTEPDRGQAPSVIPTPPLPQKIRRPEREKDIRIPNAAMHHVLNMRSQMMASGVVVIVFRVDEKSKTLLGHLKLETRGFAFVEEVREFHKIIIKRARASYEDTLKDVPDIEEKDLMKIIRRDLEIFLENTIKRSPVIIPMIISI